MSLTMPHLTAIAALAKLLVASATPALAADTRRVVVDACEGDETTCQAVENTVLAVVDAQHELVPYRVFLEAGETLGLVSYSTRTVALAAKKARVDAVVESNVEAAGRGYRITLAVREGRTGRVVDTVQMQTPRKRQLSRGVRDQIADDLLDLLEWVEPVEDRLAALQDGSWNDRSVQDGFMPRPEDRMEPAAEVSDELEGEFEQEERVQAEAGEASDGLDDNAVDSKLQPSADPDSRVDIAMAVGIAGVSRRLSFDYQSGLTPEQVPLGVSGSPAGAAVAGVVVSMADSGLSLRGRYERSLGATLAYRDGGQVKQLDVAFGEWSLGAQWSRSVRSVELELGAGYNEISYAISARPPGMTIPDTGYGFVDVGGGVRVPVWKNRATLIGLGRYLHVLNSGGITGKLAYGSARSVGYRGELALEIQAGEGVYLRLGGRYTIFQLAFIGDGELAKNLDNSPDVDVAGASDVFASGYGLVSFDY